jgi:hypothetical protein
LQSKSQVLLDKGITIGKLDVSPVEYDDLVKVFAGQVSTALKAVAMEQSDSCEPISENLRKLLIEFDDSARRKSIHTSLFGIQRERRRLIADSSSKHCSNWGERSWLKCHLSLKWPEDKQQPKELLRDIDRPSSATCPVQVVIPITAISSSRYGHFLPICLGGECADHQEFPSNGRKRH